MKALTPGECEAAAESTGAVILDTRFAEDFYKGYLPQSINVGLNGDFAPCVGALMVNVKQALLLVTDEGKAEETVTHMVLLIDCILKNSALKFGITLGIMCPDLLMIALMVSLSCPLCMLKSAHHFLFICLTGIPGRSCLSFL